MDDFRRGFPLRGAASAASSSRIPVVAGDGSQQLLDVNMEEPLPPLPPIIQFEQLLNRRGFIVEQASVRTVVSELCSGCEDLRPLELTQPVVRYTSQQFFDLYTNSEEGYHEFDGSADQFDLLLGSLHPTSLPLPITHLSVDDLVMLATHAYKWMKLGGQDLQDAVTYYLMLAMEVPASSKLLLTSSTNNELLLESTLYNQCGKKTAINEIIQNRQLYDEISDQHNAASHMVLKRLLEHQSKCSDKNYFENEVKPKLDALTNDLHQRLGRLRDFSTQPPGMPCCELKLGEQSFFANRWILATFSPVFRGMLYGNFAEGINRAQPVSIDPDMGYSDHPLTPDGLVRFLTMLHPSPLLFLWYLLPNEIIGPQDWKGHPSVIDELFKVLFNSDVAILMQVFLLAHKFQISKLCALCVAMIELKSEHTLCEKVMIADAYHLPRLMAKCLSRMTTTRGVKRMLTENPKLSDELSHQGLKLLLDRLVELL